MIFAVYGTLKRDYWNNRLLNGCKFLGEFKTEPNYTLFDGGFPIVERGGNTSIHVELFETDNPKVIETVQALEGFSGRKGHYSNWYDVDCIKTPFGIADMFVMDRGKSNRDFIVETGIWKR